MLNQTWDSGSNIREGRATDYPPPLETTEVDFNFMEWVKRSTAIFSTIGSKNRSNCDNLVFSDIMSTRYEDRNNIERIFNASLGYVWSRGLNECDMKWLEALCNYFQRRGVDSIDIVQITLREGSEFCCLWAGEVYPSRLNIIQDMLTRLSIRRNSKC